MVVLCTQYISLRSARSFVVVSLCKISRQMRSTGRGRRVLFACIGTRCQHSSMFERVCVWCCVVLMMVSDDAFCNILFLCVFCCCRCRYGHFLTEKRQLQEQAAAFYRRATQVMEALADGHTLLDASHARKFAKPSSFVFCCLFVSVLRLIHSFYKLFFLYVCFFFFFVGRKNSKISVSLLLFFVLILMFDC